MNFVSGAAKFLPALTAAILTLAAANAPRDQPALRQPGEDVNAPEVRQRPGLHPNKDLLFNGWGVTPAGEQTPVSDPCAQAGYRAGQATHRGRAWRFQQTRRDAARRGHAPANPVPAAGRNVERDCVQPRWPSFLCVGRRLGANPSFTYTNGVAAFDKSETPDANGGPRIFRRHGGGSRHGQTVCLQ